MSWAALILLNGTPLDLIADGRLPHLVPIISVDDTVELKPELHRVV